MGTTIRGADRARREQLTQLLGQQHGALQSRRRVLRDALPTETAGVTDAEELSLDAEEQGVGFGVLELTSRTVQGIEAALQRLEAGRFGTCSDCQCRISDARLRALPFASLCLACQERHDLAAGWGVRAPSVRTGLIGQ